VVQIGHSRRIICRQHNGLLSPWQVLYYRRRDYWTNEMGSDGMCCIRTIFLVSSNLLKLYIFLGPSYQNVHQPNFINEGSSICSGDNYI